MGVASATLAGVSCPLLGLSICALWPLLETASGKIIELYLFR